MMWISHDTNSLQDPKLRKLVSRYRAEGFAVYWHTLELIGKDVNENNISFSLEADPEMIAQDLNIDGSSDQTGPELVSCILAYCVELGLFQLLEERIVCLALCKRITAAQIKNPRLRTMQALVRKELAASKPFFSLNFTENHGKSLKIQKNSVYKQTNKEYKQTKNTALEPPLLDEALPQADSDTSDAGALNGPAPTACRTHEIRPLSDDLKALLRGEA